MARKILLDGLTEAPGAPAPGAETISRGQPPATEAPLRPTIVRGPVQALQNDLLANSQREIDPAHIEDDSPRDRLIVEDESIAELRELIRRQGQIVPILVRRILDRPDRYSIVYGRRRLAAIRGIPGLKVKALIRNLTDEEAFITQGQENSARKDPSFIEKTLFAKQLRDRGYHTALIEDALVIDFTVVSRMKLIAEKVPLELIEVIGAAPGVGRRRWEELARLLEGVPPEEAVGICFPEPPPEGSLSDERFELALQRLNERAARPRAALRSRRIQPLELRLKDGRRLALLKSSRTAMSLELSRKEHPGFVDWFEAEGEEILVQLYERWSKKKGSR